MVQSVSFPFKISPTSLGARMGIVLSKKGLRTKIGQKFKQPLSSEEQSPVMSLMSYTTPYSPSKTNEDHSSKETEDVYVIQRPNDIHLYLCRYYLFQLDPDIRHFQGLKILQVCCNRLRELPDEIGELSELAVLFVARNRIERLPETIYKLENLKEVNLSDNLLTTLPNSMRLLKSLETIDLSGNPMKELPVTIPYISTLRSISVLRTFIFYFPPELLRLVFLSDLFFPQPESLHKVAAQCQAKHHSLQYIQDSLIIRRLVPVSLYEKAVQKIIVKTRLLRKNTPKEIMKMILNARACDVCGNPLFSSFVTVYTKAIICDKEVLLRFMLCKTHPIDYQTPFQSLRESLFREKEYPGDPIIPNILFMFDTLTYTKEQKRLIRQEERALKNPHIPTVHLLLLKRLLHS
ncbi:hypothetical protein NEHOM01_1756 [Nematocida homosporus]|uniref:uncharacterized protein n=1 Tax=Nematocida homosporus TaxID=1912981 RepID=UPI00221FD789|nr:uncharacterized protein NEHOM01_1756 [Nematocida homosporus]KAI5186861.1 hypothetical protein NEHOM01_1756 [Nematocida homosporus]